jgi:hypothetical protein
MQMRTYLLCRFANVASNAAALMGYTMPLLSTANTAPLASQTYYVGSDLVTGIQTTYANANIIIPKTGTIKRFDLIMRLSTVYPAGVVNYALRLNDATDFAALTGDFTLIVNEGTVTGLTQAVVAGDMLALKVVTPAWGATGTGVRWFGIVFIE